MPLDAVCLQAVVAELAPQITGSRIEKIQQPARDQVVLLLRGNRRLLLSAGGGQPRLHDRENGVPPNRTPCRAFVVENEQPVEQKVCHCRNDACAVGRAKLACAVRQGDEQHGIEQSKKPIIQQKADGAAAGKTEKRFQSSLTPFCLHGKCGGK